EVYIKKALALDDSNKWYKDQYAAVLINENKFAEAAAVMVELANSEDDNNGYLINAASLYQRAGDYQKALELLDKIIAKEGNDEELLFQKQQIYTKMNDVANAEKTIGQLIAINPKKQWQYTSRLKRYCPMIHP